MKLKWQVQGYTWDVEKCGKIVERYLRRYANFENYLNTISTKEVIENGNLKLIRYSRTKAFILINYKLKNIGFYKQMGRYGTFESDKHFVEFLGSLYNNKGWNVYENYTRINTRFDNVYASAVSLIKTGKQLVHNNLIDNVATSRDKLRMRAKIKNILYREYSYGLFLKVERYTIPHQYAINENRTGTKLVAYSIEDESGYFASEDNFIFISYPTEANLSYTNIYDDEGGYYR